tara:strand:- start:5505 stop:6653 length:1149 start_codon:yes stop_codon:yes gene_type:complete
MSLHIHMTGQSKSLLACEDPLQLPARASRASSRLAAILLAIFLSFPMISAYAQESTAEPASVDEEAEALVEAAPPEPVAAPVRSDKQPKPAEMSSYAVRGLLLDIDYTGEQLIAVGERGNIIVSKDGAQWTQLEVPVRATLTAVSFVDAQHGWVVGHDATIIHTRDGGATWSVQAFNPELEQPLHNVLFLDQSRGYAFGSFGLFWQTSDGGKSWMEVHAPTVLEEGFHLNGMAQLKNGELLLVGEAGLLGYSTDGVSWERLESPYEGSFFGVVPRGEKGALVYGMRGNVYVTDDVSEAQWRKVELDTVSSIYGAWAKDDGAVILVGADATVMTVQADGSVEHAATDSSHASTDTINSAVRWPGGLMTVGESGVQPFGSKAAE